VLKKTCGCFTSTTSYKLPILIALVIPKPKVILQ
jgi:hypothetical protein